MVHFIPFSFLKGHHCFKVIVHLLQFLYISLQDDVLTVIRRVDQNWAEGMLGDKIGIFPISYVEVRNVLMDYHAFS